MRYPSSHPHLVAGITLIALGFAPPLAANPPDLLEPTTVELVTKEEFQRVLEHHRGKVVLVNLWATWCIPCIQELPELDELQHRYRDRGLQILAVSLDDLELLEERVRPFFKKTAPRLVSYLQREEDPFDFVRPLDPEWIGALPATFVLDRQGKIRKSVNGRLTLRSFEELVLPLLGEKD